MASQATIASIRYGYGLGSGRGPADGVGILERFDKGDRMATAHPLPGLMEAFAQGQAYRKLDRRVKAGEASEEDRRRARQGLFRAFAKGFRHTLARITDTDDAFRERLVAFWADHFTAVPKNPVMRAIAPAYVDEAIRPHVGGRFSDMLKAVVMHPFMLNYLDQISSAGPNSIAGKRRGMGLNENLAREVLELHTLGVGAGYSQGDVRQLAELMTGLSFDPETGFRYRRAMAEPGPETVLGKRYGREAGRLADVMAVMDDLAIRPETARHIARKLAVHFVADAPDPLLIDRLAEVFGETGGDLRAVYEAMLAHPTAWIPLGHKAKPPFDFMASTLVAVGARGDDIIDISERELRQAFGRPLQVIGQPWMGARGPDGWPEAADHWITPQGLALRIAWATGVAERLAGRIGDPRPFLERALGDAAGQRLKFAVGAAETKVEGIALVLASAEFNRR